MPSLDYMDEDEAVDGDLTDPDNMLTTLMANGCVNPSEVFYNSGMTTSRRRSSAKSFLGDFAMPLLQDSEDEYMDDFNWDKLL
jgi:hypothetical protein